MPLLSRFNQRHGGALLPINRLVSAMSNLYAIIVAILLSGCAIPVAPFYDEPYPADRLSLLKPGALQRDVIDLLGQPHASRSGGKYWYYGGTRPVVGLFLPNGGQTILDYNWVEIAFDDTLRLQHIEHYESKSGCARSGNCLLWGAWLFLEPVMSDLAVFTDTPDHDALAKHFSPPASGCAVYIFYASRMAGIARFLLQDETMAVSVGGNQPNWLNIDTYMRFEVAEGSVEIAAGRLANLLGPKLQWTCVNRDVSYFLVRGVLSDNDQIIQIETAEGQAEVSRRQLLLLR